MLIDIGDVRLFVDTAGSQWVADGQELRERPTAILLHGGPGFDHSLLKSTVGPALAEFAYVVYVDQRGHGRSDDGNDDQWVLDTWATDVHRLVEALGLERPVVLGVSFGAFVALKYASMFPSEPAATIAVSPAARFTRDLILDKFDELGGPDVRAVAARDLDDPSPEAREDWFRVCFPLAVGQSVPPEIMARAIWRPLVNERFYALHGEYRAFDLRRDLAAVRRSVLIIAGGRDPITPAEAAAEVAAAIPSEYAALRLIENAGHGIIWDHPDELVELVRSFLATLSTADR